MISEDSLGLDGGQSGRSILDSPWFKLLALAALLFLFLVSIKLLGSSFKLFGKDLADAIFTGTSNPLVALVIGLLATSLIQSSSTTTVMIVTIVAEGTIPFESAVPMIMGANIGTTITNTLVAMAHISKGDEFKRAMAGSTAHDFFNLCAVMVLFPLQWQFNLIGASAHYIEGFFEGFGGMELMSPLGLMVKPITKWIIAMTGKSAWMSAGIAIVLLFVALRYIVVTLKTLVLSKVEKFFQRYIFRTPALGFILGIILTVMVQSSSITTSLIVPLVGAGVITLIQVYPYLLGANVGTTVTAFLASFVTGSPAAVSVAFAHLIFNVYGIAIFWPLKRIPIGLANLLSEYTQRNRAVPFIYIGVVFFLVPGIIIYFAR